jgi:hypothetical protein
MASVTITGDDGVRGALAAAKVETITALSEEDDVDLDG